jgi:hypothetical protein
LALVGYPLSWRQNLFEQWATHWQIVVIIRSLIVLSMRYMQTQGMVETTGSDLLAACELGFNLVSII